MNSANVSTWSVVIGRARSEPGLKLFLLVALNLWVNAPYFFLQRHGLFAPTMMPVSFFDRLFPFFDGAIWVYFSIYLLMPIGPLLMHNRLPIIRYAIGVAVISVLADLVFFWWPTSCPRPTADGTIAIYQRFTAIEKPSNAFPSLHAAFAVFSALCAVRVFQELHLRAFWKAVIWLWACLILLATLLTKQHVLADIVAGSGLGLAVYFSIIL